MAVPPRKVFVPQNPITQSFMPGQSQGSLRSWNPLRYVITVVLLVGVFFAGHYFAKRSPITPSTEEYSAVFLENNQVYFGMVTWSSTEFLDLTDVYYFASPEDKGKELVLTRLGSEVHGPTNFMRISLAHVLYIETLRDDSRVVQAIKEEQRK